MQERGGRGTRQSVADLRSAEARSQSAGRLLLAGRGKWSTGCPSAVSLCGGGLAWRVGRVWAFALLLLLLGD